MSLQAAPTHNTCAELHTTIAWHMYNKAMPEAAFHLARYVLRHPARLRDEQRASLHMLLSKSSDDAVSHAHTAVFLYGCVVGEARKEGRLDQVAHFRGLLEQAWAGMNEAKKRNAQ
ncbi:uncharacterized protein BKA78DRAFT_297471 [Phyllosticta capitalensis]|uniref:uncharacterized protein n=1 Tax=Phyllosticta capitalensis TaxID=121624 RepID=UPI003130CC34